MSNETTPLEQSVTSPEQLRKTIKNMSPEERRAYNAQSKRKSRGKEKQARLAAMVPAYADFRLPDAQRDQLAEHSRHMIETIGAELPTLSYEDGRMVEMMADVLLGYEKDWTKQVHSPHGYLYGRYFPDAACEVIEHVHRFPGLLASQTFADLYQKFLKTVRKLSRNTTWFDPEFAKDIEAELSGTYIVRPKPDIPTAPEPAPPEPKLPNEQEIFEQGRLRLLDRLSGIEPNLPPDARHYLNGN